VSLLPERPDRARGTIVSGGIVVRKSIDDHPERDEIADESAKVPMGGPIRPVIEENNP
jgi:hypothetical protein